MAFIVDGFHKKKLKDLNINIETSYIVGNEIVKRKAFDTSVDIKNGIRCMKEYYVNEKLSHIENDFDSRIEYSFISSDLNNKEYKCSNCGMEYKISDDINCPYCGTYYNIDYIDKELGSKYHYDRVLRSNTYKIMTGVVDLIFSLIISFIFLKSTSRTFNVYDISKVFIYGFILSIILYYFFYLIDAYVVIGPIKRYKDKKNKKQMEFWNRTKIDKKTFFNNLNLELRKKYYSKGNIVDYDIIDYLDFDNIKKNDKYYVNVKVEVRLVEYKNNKIVSKYINENLMFYRNDNVKRIKAGDNIINCYGCGASINILSDKCEYCNSELNYFQEWILEN